MRPYDKNDPCSIQKMFGTIAKRYDRTNAILSLQMHRYWNRQLIKETLTNKPPCTYLDLCCGTGEISLKYLQATPVPCEAYLLDFCPEMLFYAQERAEKNHSYPHKITYLQADAQEIPLPNESMDSITMAYGIRNIPNPKKCFHEIHRILKSRGRFGLLELTEPQNGFLKAGHSLYLKSVLPIIGKLVTSNREAYQYLCNSIKNFVKPHELEKMLIDVGFKTATVKPLMGGIATLILVDK